MVTEKFKIKRKLNVNPLESNGLHPDPNSLLHKDTIDLKILKRLVGQSILSVKQFDRDLVCEICKFAAVLEATEIAKSHPLDGKIVITAFFEASTRTRLSFESAAVRLDGKILSIPEGGTTGVAKGESLSDIGEMFNAYGDVVVMRHTKTDAIIEIMQNLRIPLINAGNGTGEHPTHALTDLFAILKW
jgi:aspartate carbamoyltransferase catalytic subunit